MVTQCYYSRPIKIPQTKRDGLENFVQMIINRLEAGEDREALLQAVDLLDSVRCGQYDESMADAKGFNAMAREMATQHQSEITAASEAGYARGQADERARIARQLGLVS